MNARRQSLRRPASTHAGLLVFVPFLLLASCAAAPFLIPAGIEFARNLLVTSNKNYGGKYSEDMNRLMVRLSTPYVAMGLPMGTSPAALVPPTMLMQQQQAMMNAQASGQQGVGMGMGMGYPDPYNPAGGMAGGYGMQGYGGMGGYGGMSGYGGMGGYGTSQYGYQGQVGGYYDPSNPYASVPGMNVQAPAYGMTQPYGGQYGQYGTQPYGGQMGGYPPQPGYPAQQGLPPQPGYPSAAPGMAAQAPLPAILHKGCRAMVSRRCNRGRTNSRWIPINNKPCRAAISNNRCNQGRWVVTSSKGCRDISSRCKATPSSRCRAMPSLGCRSLMGRPLTSACRTRAASIREASQDRLNRWHWTWRSSARSMDRTESK
ncbi:MAG: hypothetical protein U0231_20660 [Nitrospiraceae bacterium]